MEILRIPVRYAKQLSRLSKEERLWVFDSMMKLCQGEDVIQKDSIAGDTLELIRRDAILMEQRNTKKEDMSVGSLISESLGTDNTTHSEPERKGKEMKGKERKGNETSCAIFEIFWNIYPKKVGKGAAKKSWEKIKPDKELCKKIAIALEEQMQSTQWRKDGGAYIPNPATWLNQQRWEDKPVTLTHPVQETYQVQPFTY